MFTNPFEWRQSDEIGQISSVAVHYHFYQRQLNLPRNLAASCAKRQTNCKLEHMPSLFCGTALVCGGDDDGAAQ